MSAFLRCLLPPTDSSFINLAEAVWKSFLYETIQRDLEEALDLRKGN